jgi:hypothetical protein
LYLLLMNPFYLQS